MPRVTVIIATYNWSTVLPYSVGSVLRQTFDDFEVWVVGDGCTDDTAEVMARFEDARVRWHNLPVNRRDQAYPNQWALENCESEFVSYLNHDDLYMPYALEVMLEEADRTKRPALHGIGCMINPGEYQLAGTWVKGHHGTWFLSPSCVMHRRDVGLEVGGWIPASVSRMVPQEHLWLRIAEKTGRFASVYRLTAVKFPAAHRKNVYRERPCHEQKEYFRRTVEEPDFEARHLAYLLGEYSERANEYISPARHLSLAARGYRSKLRGLLGQRFDGYEFLKKIQRQKGLTGDEGGAAARKRT